MDRIRFLRTVALGFLALLAACGGDAAAGVRVAVVPKGTQNEFWKAIHAGARRAAAELGVGIEWQGPQPEGDREAQIRVVENVLAMGVQGLVLAPVDEVALVPAVEDAARAGVPTVVIDSGLRTDRRVSMIATDNHAGGRLAARRLGELLGGKGRIVMLRFLEGSASTTAREAGFREELAAAFPQVQVLSDNQYGGNHERALSTSESLLLAHRDLDGAFCPNESTTLGMLLALRAAGLAGRVKFVGFDSSDQLIDGLAQGHIHGLVLQDPVQMGYLGVRAMVQHLRGEPVAAAQNTELVLATPENRAEPRIAGLLRPDLSSLGR